ncbi:transglutaminaseTgpA domain-containing protein [Thermodesulfobacteriota bacterium]
MTEEDKYIPALLVAILIAFGPNILRLPIWITGWCLLCWGYSFLAAANRLPWPGKLTRNLLAFFGFTFGLLTYGHTLGREAGVGLLSLMVGLKPLETRTHRDRMMTIFLTYFLIIANLFYSKSLLMTIYLFLSVLCTTVVLIYVNHPGGPMRRNFRLAALVMVQALPLMVIFFLLFPRIHGSLWGISKSATGTSGISDHLMPGAIASVARSNEIAFRVEFSGNIPDSENLYWRGLIFWEFNGESWRPGSKPPPRLMPMVGGNIVEYTITLEPHERRWLFAMDLPQSRPRFARIQDDHTLLAWRPIKEKLRYSIQSYRSYNTGPLKGWEQRALERPLIGNPQAIALASKWTQKFDHSEKIIEAALHYFRENNFVYSLNPPLLGRDTIDDFLFRTRKGYCEHYASAFAFLMRAANIPSRIVGGYLGGEINPFGNYLIVRQSDAHAWVEVWLSGKGWVRIDPTSAVAPERVEHGMAAALPPEELASFLSSSFMRPFAGIIKKVSLGWDAVNNLWHQQIMGYSFFRQKSLLAKIGIKGDSWKGPAKAFILAIGFVGVFVLFFAILLFQKPTEKQDPIQKTYIKFCTKLDHIGLPKGSAQGPVDYMTTVISARKDLEESVKEIIGRYINLRYRSGGDEAAHKKFKSLVRQFKPHRNK